MMKYTASIFKANKPERFRLTYRTGEDDYEELWIKAMSRKEAWEKGLKKKRGVAALIAVDSEADVKKYEDPCWDLHL